MKLPTNKIICGDCVNILETFPENCIDLTVTSPPYGNLRDYYNYTFDFKAIAFQLLRVTKLGGVVVWVVSDTTVKGSRTLTSFEHALYFKQIGFNVHDVMIYYKKNFSMPSKTRYHNIYELMIIFSKERPKTFNPIKDRKNICAGQTRKGKNTKRQVDGSMKTLAPNDENKPVYNEFGMRHNIWVLKSAGQEKMCKSLDHPAMFPEQLANDHILSWSNPGDTVLDPMCGSGTTCKMAKLNNRNYIGIDISEEYCDLSRRRVDNL